MSATSGRFTAYLPDERELLRELEREEGCSANYLVRLGLRALLGLEVPSRYRTMILENLERQDERARERAAA